MFKALDFVVIAISLFAIIWIAQLFAVQQETMLQVEVRAGQERYLYPLEEEQVLRFKGPIGYSVIRIANNQVQFILPADCNDKICIQMGQLEEINEWAACLPNQVLVRIIGNDAGKVDGISS